MPENDLKLSLDYTKALEDLFRVFSEVCSKDEYDLMEELKTK